MAYNFRSINDVPVSGSLTSGDKVILNSGGIAKQIDASKIGGGGGMLYAQMTSTTSAYVYADEGYTRMLTYDEAKKAIMLGATFIAEQGGYTIVLTPLATTCVDSARMFQVTAMLQEITYLTIGCSDTVMQN